MRIDSSAIGMESERRYSSTVKGISKITITDKGQALMDGTGGLFGNLAQPEGGEAGQQGESSPDDSKDFITKTMEEMNAKQKLRTQNIRTPDLLETKKQLADIRQQCLNFLMDLFFGRSGLRSRGYEENIQESSSAKSSYQNTVDKQSSLLWQNSSNVKVFTFSRQTYYAETEDTTFTTQGTVKCADGREISFNLNMNMSRSFQEYYTEYYSVQEVQMCDPLVINLSGNVAELSDQTFYFDIDGDGELDQINRLAAGSGYLALDKNGDGIINDGTELFGTASGNGFADLAAYDSDGNGFIDEGDEIWSRLKIWTMDEDGNEQLASLSEKGVGAICLANAATDFALKGQDNNTKGMIRNTGFFLYEDGAVGSVQHVDVAKYSQTA